MPVRMPLTEHLEELRRRLLIVLVPWVVLVGVAFTQADALLGLLARPAGTLVTLSPAEAFLTSLRLAAYVGTAAVSPLALYQAIAFVVPGLEPHERRLLLTVVPFAAVLFVGGVAFGYLLVLPLAWRFLLGFAPANITPMISLGRYLSFVAGLTLPFGVVFELPVVVFLLARLGIVSAAFLRAQRKYALLLILVVAAVLTPPDVISQLLMAAPLYVLYEVSIWIARWAAPRGEQDLRGARGGKSGK
ncbi:MAG TPA: twin-arginine translocase subunit TatC [Bacillota bacterium]